MRSSSARHAAALVSAAATGIKASVRLVPFTRSSAFASYAPAVKCCLDRTRVSAGGLILQCCAPDSQDVLDLARTYVAIVEVVSILDMMSVSSSSFVGALLLASSASGQFIRNLGAGGSANGNPNEDVEGGRGQFNGRAIGRQPGSNGDIAGIGPAEINRVDLYTRTCGCVPPGPQTPVRSRVL